MELMVSAAKELHMNIETNLANGRNSLLIINFDMIRHGQETIVRAISKLVLYVTIVKIDLDILYS